MIENLKKLKFAENNDPILSSLLSFKKAFDQKINKITNSNQSLSPPKDHFINIYKNNSNEELVENGSVLPHSQVITSSQRAFKISDSDIFSNSELLMSNIDDILYKDISNGQAIVKVPTSDSLSENDDDQKAEPIENKKTISPNTTGHNFYKNERLNSIDEKDESKEDDTISKSSKERITEDYYIVNEKELRESFLRKEKELQKEKDCLKEKELQKEKDCVKEKEIKKSVEVKKEKDMHIEINFQKKEKDLRQKEKDAQKDRIPKNEFAQTEKSLEKEKETQKLNRKPDLERKIVQNENIIKQPENQKNQKSHLRENVMKREKESQEQKPKEQEPKNIKNSREEKNKEKSNNMPTFAFLDYKEFKNKSEHSSNEKFKESGKNANKELESSASMNTLPTNNNNSNMMKKNNVKSNNSSKKDLKLDDLIENTSALEKTFQKKTPETGKSHQNHFILATPQSQNTIISNKTDQMKYSSLHSPRSETGGVTVNLKAYASVKVVKSEKKEKQEKNALNPNKSLSNSKKTENNDSYYRQAQKNTSKRNKSPILEKTQISQIKEKAQKDIKTIEKEISQELSLLSMRNASKFIKNMKNQTKSSSCNEKEIVDINKNSNKPEKATKKYDKSQQILKNISGYKSFNSPQKKPEIITGNKETQKSDFIDQKAVSSRKNSKNSNEPPIFRTPGNFSKARSLPKNNNSNSTNDLKKTMIKQNNEKTQNLKSSYFFSNTTSSFKTSETKTQAFGRSPSREKEKTIKKPEKIPKNEKMRPNTDPKKKKNEKNLEIEKNHSCQKEIPKDLWEEIKQICNLFSEMDHMIVKNTNSTAGKNVLRKKN